jgi:hypothetical protein
VPRVPNGCKRWSADYGYGKCDRRGIHWYPALEDQFAENPSLTIPWRDVLDVIKRGSVDGRRERYDDAWKAYVEHGDAPLPVPWTPAYLLAERGQSKDSYFRVKRTRLTGLRASGSVASSQLRPVPSSRPAVLERPCRSCCGEAT